VNGGCHVCAPGTTQSCGHAAVGICHPGTQTCQPDGSWGGCVGDQEPLPRDCTSSADNNCDGVPDNTIDSVCQCAIGTSVPCGTHPQDGTGACKAGTASCVAGPGNSSSSVGGCTGSVGPGTDTCDVPSGDLDCDGIEGDGPGCFTEYWVFFSNPPTNSWVCPTTPADMKMATSSTPPSGYGFLTTIKLPSATNPNAVPIYSCSPINGPPFGSGGNCGLMEGSTFVANGSSKNGGNGWVAIDYQVAKHGGVVGLLPAGDSHCCNCTGVTTWTGTMPLYTVPTAP
jgi:hypothetical protein